MKSLMVVLTAAAILVFVVLVLLSRQPRRTYLLYMLYALPLIDFKITAYPWGSLTLFDGFSYVLLFWRYKVAYEKSRNIRRNMASAAELKKSFFAEIDKVKNRTRSPQETGVRHGVSMAVSPCERLRTHRACHRVSG